MCISKKQASLFIITPLNFEEIALLELNEKTKLLGIDDQVDSIIMSEGGISLNTSLACAEKLCRLLKIPTRILLRITSFKTKDAPNLYNRSLKIKWNDYLRGKLPEVHISTKESRLFDSRKIKKALDGSIDKYFKLNPCKEKYLSDPGEAHIFIRIIKDEATISIALDGQRLNQRGDKLQINSAPLRENLAAALLYFTHSKIAPITNMIDPMCGSGTFALEALSFYKRNNRDLYIEKLPLFLKEPQTKNILIEKKIVEKFHLFDQDEQSLEYSKNNLERLGITETDYKIDKTDVFDLNNIEILNSVAILNPPYGVRIKVEGSLSDYYHKLIQAVFTKFKVSHMGLIIPSDIRLEPKSFNILASLPFSNGGLKVRFLLLDTPEF